MKNGLMEFLFGVMLVLVVGLTFGVIPLKNNQKQEKKESLSEIINLLDKRNNEIFNAKLEKIDATLKDNLSSISEQIQHSKSQAEMASDKLSEIQDQINELNETLANQSEKIKKLEACADRCLNPVKKEKPKPKKIEHIKKEIPCKESQAYINCVQESQSTWDQNCSQKDEPIVSSKLLDKNVVRKGSKTETQVALIRIDTPKKHPMCMTPRNFYESSCHRVVCEK